MFGFTDTNNGELPMGMRTFHPFELHLVFYTLDSVFSKLESDKSKMPSFGIKINLNDFKQDAYTVGIFLHNLIIRFNNITLFKVNNQSVFPIREPTGVNSDKHIFYVLKKVN